MRNFRCAGIFLPFFFLFSFSVVGHCVGFTVEDTSVQLYGYTKVDAIYDTKSDLGPATNRALIPVDDQVGKEGNFQMHAFESRIGVKTVTPLNNGDLVTVVEGDFYGAGGRLRLRHAYGSWNGLLVGQTWTNFGALIGRTPSIDFASEPGTGNTTRQAQIRYTYEGLSVALEEPSFLGGPVASDVNTINGTPIQSTAAISRLPDLTLRYIGSIGPARFAFSALGRELRHDDGSRTGSKFGWGTNVEAAWQISNDLTLRGSATYGDGIGTYLENNPSAPAFYDATSNTFETVEAMGATISITQAVGPGTVTLGHGIAEANLDPLKQGTFTNIFSANDRFSGTHLNYVWTPQERITYGVEIARHYRRVVDGRDGTNTRLQLTGKYQF